jgi:hypothetical protein
MAENNVSLPVLLAGAAAVGVGGYFLIKSQGGGGGGGGGKKQYTLTITVSPGSVAGSVESSPAASVFWPGDIVTLTAHAAPGYGFDHWEEGAQKLTYNPVEVTMPASNLAVKAVFVPTSTNGAVNITMTITPNPVEINNYAGNPAVLHTSISNPGSAPLNLYIGWVITINGVKIWDNPIYGELIQPNQTLEFNNDFTFMDTEAGAGFAAVVARIDSGTGVLAGEAHLNFTVISTID